jgi:hypothetical protein
LAGPGHLFLGSQSQDFTQMIGVVRQSCTVTSSAMSNKLGFENPAYDFEHATSAKITNILCVQSK